MPVAVAGVRQAQGGAARAISQRRNSTFASSDLALPQVHFSSNIYGSAVMKYYDPRPLMKHPKLTRELPGGFSVAPIFDVLILSHSSTVLNNKATSNECPAANV